MAIFVSVYTDPLNKKVKRMMFDSGTSRDTRKPECRTRDAPRCHSWPEEKKRTINQKISAVPKYLRPQIVSGTEARMKGVTRDHRRREPTSTRGGQKMWAVPKYLSSREA